MVSRNKKLTKGYVVVYAPDHPLARKDGYVLEHRFVLHEAGVPIPKGHDVHHVNGDRTDNRLENLEVLPHRTHAVFHFRKEGTRNQHGIFSYREDRACEQCGKTFRAWRPSSRFCSRSCANRGRK